MTSVWVVPCPEPRLHEAATLPLWGGPFDGETRCMMPTVTEWTIERERYVLAVKYTREGSVATYVLAWAGTYT